MGGGLGGIGEKSESLLGSLSAQPCLRAVFQRLGHLGHLEGVWTVLEFLPHTPVSAVSCWLGVESREGAGFLGHASPKSDHRTPTKPGDRDTHVCLHICLQNREKKIPSPEALLPRGYGEKIGDQVTGQGTRQSELLVDYYWSKVTILCRTH